MRAFVYHQPKTLADAVRLLSQRGGMAIAGGQDILGAMKDGLFEPEHLVNLKSLPELGQIEENASGLHIGALATLAEIAEHPVIRRDYTALAEAAAAVATPQIRNVGTIGGNLCQRPRCWYFRDPHVHCLKKGGDQCYAVRGDNRYHAIISPGPCYIVHPSDCAPALIALGARATVAGARGTRTVALRDFFQMPDKNLKGENILQPGEVVTRVIVPKPKAGTRSTYLKVREKDSFDWALVSVAVVIQLQGGICRAASVVLGGVAPVPYDSPAAAKALVGKPVNLQTAAAAGKAAVQGATPLEHNAYKVPLAEAVVKRAVMAAAGIRS
ncbi:MAG: xanthine dehydrogenase family protein subunit M [Armatimonadota bacterium]|nr:xanthine dehydrogenase family protein subunit M [Armatimonadota bacterium]